MTHIYDEETGKVEKGRNGLPELRLIEENGFIGNGPEMRAPCRDPKRSCPKGCPESPKTLTAQNWQCFEHYQECVAVGDFPKDPIVRQNARIIRAVLDAFEDYEKSRRHNELVQLIVSVDK